MPAQIDTTFPSGGERCAAYVLRPDGATGDVPCVVMAHGFSATRDDGLPPYAEAFAAAGMAVVLFDYRFFGASSGEPRQLLSIAAQRDDYRAAVEFARGLDGVDPNRIALWGSSFSGGHVLTVAARDARIAAVVCQAPFVDGPATVREIPIKNILQGTVEGLRDQAGALLGRPPHYMPAVGPPGSLAAMTAPEAEPGFAKITGEGSKWENRFAARLMLTLATDRPGRHAAKLAMPLLMVVCDEDQTTPAEPAVKVAERAPRGELQRYAIGHFEIYDHLEARAAQVDFLVRHLEPAGDREGATA